MGDLRADERQTWADLQDLETGPHTSRGSGSSASRSRQERLPQIQRPGADIATTPAAAGDVILHVDIDSFYCEVERMDDPSLRGRPLVVQQFNAGGFVAVSYEAKGFGIKKGDGVGAGGRANIKRLQEIGAVSVHEAKRLCPGLIVKSMRTDRYREVALNIQEALRPWAKGRQVEKASYDDFYLVADIPQQLCVDPAQLSGVHNIGGGSCLQLSADLQQGCYLALEIQMALKGLGLSSSLGVSRRKLLSRLISPLNKPMAISVISDGHALDYMHSLRLEDIPGFQGMLGQHVCQCLGVQTVGQIACVPDPELVSRFGGRKAEMLTRLSKGEDLHPVLERGPQKTIICERSCPPLRSVTAAQELLKTLSHSLIRRLVEDFQRTGQRLPSRLHVSWRQEYGTNMCTRSTVFPPACTSALSRLSRRGSADDPSSQHHEALASDITSCAMELLLEHVPIPWAITRLVIGGAYAVKTAEHAAAATRMHNFLKPSSQVCEHNSGPAVAGDPSTPCRLMKISSGQAGGQSLPTPAPLQSPENGSSNVSSTAAEPVTSSHICNKLKGAPMTADNSPGVLGKRQLATWEEEQDAGQTLTNPDGEVLMQVDLREQRQIWHQIRTDFALQQIARAPRCKNTARSLPKGRMNNQTRRSQTSQSGSIMQFLKNGHL